MSTVTWYNSGWQYRKKITIDGTKVAGTNAHLNFPLLINSIDPEWKSTSNGGRVVKADGTDVLFTAADGTTKLDHEIEKYVNTTGELIAWVRLPQLAPGPATEIFVYYGNAAAPNQQNKAGVWDSNYRGVWHLLEGVPSMSGGADATVHGHTGAPVGTINPYGGKIDGSFDFTPASNYLDHANRTSLQLTGRMTISTWIHPRSYTNTGAIIGKQGGGGQRGWVIRLDSYGGINFNVAVDKDNVVSTYSSVLPLNTWSHVTAVYEPGVALRLYVNGVLDGENTTSIPLAQHNNSLNVLTGKRNGCSPCEIDSRLDEVRVLAVDRSAGWILTEYTNQSAPSTFYSIAAGEQRAPTPTDTPTATATPTPTASTNTDRHAGGDQYTGQ
jgi:hypothetical protein